MPKAYVIFTEDIKDEEGMEAYGKASLPSIIESGASVLAFDAGPQVLEGEWHGSRTVVLEFASVEAARAWYESDSYQQAKGLRLAAAESNGVIITGL